MCLLLFLLLLYCYFYFVSFYFILFSFLFILFFMMIYVIFLFSCGDVLRVFSCVIHVMFCDNFLYSRDIHIMSIMYFVMFT